MWEQVYNIILCVVTLPICCATLHFVHIIVLEHLIPILSFPGFILTPNLETVFS
jgi:hypothetical protein